MARRNNPSAGRETPPVAPLDDDARTEDDSVPGTDPVVEGDPAAQADGSDDDALEDQNRQDMRKLRAAQRAKVAKVVAGIVAAVLLITFGMQNARPVGVRFLAWTARIDLVWVVVIAAALGSVLGYLVGRPPKNLRLHEPARRRDDRPRK